MASSSRSQPKRGVVDNTIKDEKRRIDNMANKMKEKFKQIAEDKAKKQAASPAHCYINRKGKRVLFPPVSITTKINETNNQEILNEDCVYKKSIEGKFAWASIKNYHLPYIIRVINGEDLKFVSVRMVETQVLSKYFKCLHPDIYKCTKIKSYSISHPEARLLDEINRTHTEYLYGEAMFVAGKEFVVTLEDVQELHTFLEDCYTKMLSTQSNNEKFGFIRINCDYYVPFCSHDGKQFLPTFYFDGDINSIMHQTVQLENWPLAYLKFCCAVQGIHHQLYNSDSCNVIDLNHLKGLYAPETTFRFYWPPGVRDSPLMLKQNSGHFGNQSGSWIRAPENAIPRRLIQPAPPITQSIPEIQNTYQNGSPANQLIPQQQEQHHRHRHQQEQHHNHHQQQQQQAYGDPIRHGAYNDNQERKKFRSGRKIATGLPVSETIDLLSPPTSPVPPTVQENYIHPTSIPEPMWSWETSNHSANKIPQQQEQHHRHRHQQEQHHNHHQQQQQQAYGDPIRHGAYNDNQERKKFRSGRKIATGLPVSETIDLLSPPTSPVPPTVQENYIHPTSIPEPMWSWETSNHSANK